MRPTIFLAGCLAVFWAMAVSVSPRVGATSDEQQHLAAGYSYWKFNDYRLQPENGNLPMRLEALPLLALDLRFPSVASEHWRQASGNDVGHEFLFGTDNPFSTMLWLGRAMVALFGVLAALLVWWWARHLFGTTAGYVSLLLAIFCPTLLAHAGLATSDMAITVGLLAAVTMCWQLLHRVTWLRLLGASLAVTAALLAKYSAALLAPIAGLMLLLRWVYPAPLVICLGPRSRWVRRRAAIVGMTLTATTATAAIAWAGIWAAYGFRFSAFSAAVSTQADPPRLPWAAMLEDARTILVPAAENSAVNAAPATAPATNAVCRVIAWARDQRVLPEAYLYGFANSYIYSRARNAFLLGETSPHGWPQFFPIAFLLKTPPTLLLLLAAGVGAIAMAAARPQRLQPRWPRRGWLYRSSPLLILFFVYWAVAINTPLNIGHRHLLPVYPTIYIFAGAAAGWLGLTRRRGFVMLALGGAIAVHAITSWAARPFYLSYFAPWAGGAENGWRYLVDSSSDWGQGLPDLAAWIRAKESRGDNAPVFLTYFGTDSPEARHLPVVRFGDLVDDLKPRAFPAQVRGGWFAISATHFHGVYLGLSGPWNAAREKRYRDLMQKLRNAPANLDALPEEERRSWAGDAQNYERLQFGRLASFLRARSPAALVGGSLLIFRLSDAEVQRALYGPVEFAVKRP